MADPFEYRPHLKEVKSKFYLGSAEMSVQEKCWQLLDHQAVASRPFWMLFQEE